MVFTYYPFLRNFQIGLYQSPPFPGLPSKFVGTQQFTSMLSSPIFWDCVKTTALFVVFVVPLGVFGGLVMAVMAHQRLKGIQIYRTIFSSTVVSSAAVAALVYEAFVSPLNGYLRALGIHVSDLTVNPTWSLPVVALVSAWQFVGLAFIIFTAGLQSVPDDIMEAARVDGASSWTRLWRVTLPLLSPTVFFCIVVGVIFSLQSFGQIDIMVTSPNSAFAHTNVLIYYIYQLLRVQQNPGLAACYSVALFVITLVVTLIQFRLLEKRVHYGN
jgi:ABC-type sugar transport system permease subunit